jgi:hypothetical protein
MTVSAAGATLAVLLAAPAGPAAPFLAAAMTPLTTRLAQKVDEELRRKTTVIAETAVRTSGIYDPEEFCEALTSTPEMIGLTQKILFAATVTGNQTKLRALGAILGTAVGRRHNQLDETNLLIDALTDLEAPHVVVMNVIAEPAWAPPKYDNTKPGWLALEVQNEVAIEPDLVLAILSMLTRHGLAKSTQVLDGETRYELTTFGNALAAQMNNASEPPEDPAP